MENDRIFNTSIDFEFIATMLTSMIGHDCTCGSCTSRRQRAMSALIWLCGKVTPVQMQVRERNGQNEVYLAEPQRAMPRMPQEIIDAAKARLRDESLTLDQRAVINGFLSSVEGHGNA